MRIKLFVLIFTIFAFGLSSCASIRPHPRKWTKTEKVAAGYFIVAHVVNAYTTERHQDEPDKYYEMNPVLGKHPSDQEIVAYFSLTGIGALVLAHFYPELRKPLLIGYGTLNSALAIHDYELTK